MKLMICGSRTITDKEVIKRAIDHFNLKPTKIIHGGAKGVDLNADRYAVEHRLPVEVFPANWQRYGRSAGVIRNRMMIEACDEVLAIWDGKSRGTNNSIETAKEMGKPRYVIIISDNGEMTGEEM